MQKLCVMIILGVLSVPSLADSQYFIGLNSIFDDDPDLFVVDTVVFEVADHSIVDVFVENVLDPARYKDWDFKVWLPGGSPALAEIFSLEYDSGSGGVDYGLVPMAYAPSDATIAGYDMYYASTFEAAWYAFGTQPVGSDLGRIDIGSPAWVNFHVDIDPSITAPIFFQVYDVSAPEPMSILLLGFGGLVLVRCRK